MVQETNTIKKRVKKGIIRIALIYPSIYEAALSSLVFHLIYFLVNTEFEEVYLERFVLRSLYGREPEPRSLDTGSPLKDFNVIIASIHYEPDYVNLIRMLLSGGIEVDRVKRSRPLIFVGGPAPSSNPKPLRNIVDGVLVGEAEELLPKLIEHVTVINKKNMLLETLAKEEGFYISELDNTVKRVWVKDLDKTFYPLKQIQSQDIEPVYGRGFILESSRGCPRWCRFCVEGRLFRPFRQRSFSYMKDLVERGLELNKVERVVVYSLFYPTKTDLRLLDYIRSNGLKASLPSMRIDFINEDVLDLIKDVGQKTVTIAPENVSLKGMRGFCKCFREGDLVEKPKIILDRGFNLKMYFIIGFKGETISDIKKNIDYIKNVARYAKARKRNISVTINPLVPKPKTPFQWIGMIDLDRAKKIVSYIKRELGRLVDTRPLYVNWAWIQASISLADESIGKLLIEWALEGGGLGGWRRALRRTGFSTKYVFTGWRYGEKLPWDNIIVGEYVEEVVEKEYHVVKNMFKI